MLYKYKQYRYPISPYSLARTRKIYEYITLKSPRKYRYVSRYSKTNIIADKNGPDVHESSYNIEIDQNTSDTYFTVNKATENRLDLISVMFYDFPSYWWVIATANNILDPFNVPIGTVLRIPALSSLYGNKGILS